MLRSTSVVITTTGRLAVDDVVAGQQADVVGAVALDQVVVLLVRQRLDRGGVERLAPGLQRQVDGELADDRLARAGGRRDEHAAALLDLLAGPHLEVVELEAVEAGEVLEHREGLLAPERRVALGGRLLVLGRGAGRGAHAMTSRAPGTHSTVSGSGPKRSPSAYDTMPGAATVTERTRWWTYSATPSMRPVNRRG